MWKFGIFKQLSNTFRAIFFVTVKNLFFPFSVVESQVYLILSEENVKMLESQLSHLSMPLPKQKAKSLTHLYFLTIYSSQTKHITFFKNIYFVCFKGEKMSECGHLCVCVVEGCVY